MTTSVTILCHDLARVLGNALHFMPARNRVEHVALVVDRDSIMVSGCRDGYVAGTDVAEVTSSAVPDMTAMLLPEDAEALKKVAQAGKKFPASLTVDGGTVTIETSETSASVPAVGGDADRDRRMYSALFDLMVQAEVRQNAIPGVLMIDPALMAPFAKVKADSTDRKADLLIKDPKSPILVKIGPTFRGLIQPIHRDKNAEKAGEDGLW